MENSLSFDQNQRVVELSSPTKSISKTGITFSLLLFLLFFVVLAFFGGYLFGKSRTASNQEVTKGKTSVETKDSKSTFKDPNENYSITFPKDWKLTEKKDGTAGVVIKTPGVSVETWIGTEQPYKFDKERKEAISEEKKVKIKINGKEVEMTQFTYNTGGVFSIAILPATEKNTLATLWIDSEDPLLYPTAKEIVSSFKFN